MLILCLQYTLFANTLQAYMIKSFKKTLRAWRKSRGFVQKEAAEFLCVSKRTYEGWEYGKTSPKPLAMAELIRRMEAL